MKRIALVLALLLAGMSTLPATAGDAAVWRYNRHSAEPPFPLSGRSESVWASGACWSECGSYTAWNLVACLERDRQGRCLKYTDAADRACQRECRTRGGPLLPIGHAVSARFLARKLEFRASNPSLDIRPEPRRATGIRFGPCPNR